MSGKRLWENVHYLELSAQMVSEAIYLKLGLSGQSSLRGLSAIRKLAVTCRATGHSASTLQLQATVVLPSQQDREVPCIPNQLHGTLL